jgi:hypothetical protein
MRNGNKEKLLSMILVNVCLTGPARHQDDKGMTQSFESNLITHQLSNKYIKLQVFSTHLLLEGHICILLANALLDRRACCNAINPLQQMRERFHLLLSETCSFPALDPWPRLDVGGGVLSLAMAS